MILPDDMREHLIEAGKKREAALKIEALQYLHTYWPKTLPEPDWEGSEGMLVILSMVMNLILQRQILAESMQKLKRAIKDFDTEEF